MWAHPQILVRKKAIRLTFSGQMSGWRHPLEWLSAACLSAVAAGVLLGGRAVVAQQPSLLVASVTASESDGAPERLSTQLLFLPCTEAP